MPFLGKTPAQGFVNSVTKDDFTPNGTTTAFTLSKSPATVNEIEVYVGNVRQEPTDAYSVSGTTLTMTEAPATGTNFYVMHIGGTTQSSTTLPGGSVVPGALSVSGDLAVDTSAFFVDASTNKVGIGTVTPTFNAGNGLHIKGAGTDFTQTRVTAGSNTGVDFAQANDGKGYVYNRDNADIIFGVNNAETLRLVAVGNRGTSDFTIRAWINFNGTGTIAIRDSHNVSSIVDGATGDYVVNFAAGMPSANYATGLGIGGAAVLISSGRGGMTYNTTSAYRIGVRDGTTEAWTDTELVTAMWCGG